MNCSEDFGRENGEDVPLLLKEDYMFQPADMDKLAAELGRPETWWVLLAVATAGVLGGWARQLTAPASESAANKADAIVGGVTALAMLMVIPAQQLVSLLGLSIVSGFAGKSLLDALRSRAEALVAKEQAKEARDAATAADEKRKEAVKAGLSAVKKANELAAAGEHVNSELTILEPSLRTSLAKASPRLFVAEGQPTHHPMLFSANVKADLEVLERRLENLL